MHLVASKVTKNTEIDAKGASACIKFVSYQQTKSQPKITNQEQRFIYF